MTRCANCNDDLDGEPQATATLDIGSGWSVCLPCGVKHGGEYNGIRLTHDGAIAALREVSMVFQALTEALKKERTG